MNAVLEDLVGQEVQVWSGEQGIHDVGRLEGYEHPWLRIRKTDGTVLCFPAYRVRLVKLLGKGERDAHVVAA